ncbi:MAG: hypothetical protein OXF02_06225 [Simkaniaceae bacterium]|nr:hypothetical protein [Simkaniaceae bacterium]
MALAMGKRQGTVWPKSRGKGEGRTVVEKGKVCQGGSGVATGSIRAWAHYPVSDPFRKEKSGGGSVRGNVVRS